MRKNLEDIDYAKGFRQSARRGFLIGWLVGRKEAKMFEEAIPVEPSSDDTTAKGQSEHQLPKKSGSLKSRPGSSPPPPDDYKTKYMVRYRFKGNPSGEVVEIMYRVKLVDPYWQSWGGHWIDNPKDEDVLWWIPLDEVLKEVE